jgi:myo-inositol-1(or 4)-monophosphatase
MKENLMLNTAIEAAKRAGHIIAEHYPMGRNVTQKGFRDLVTETDTAAEAVIIDIIKENFPTHDILSEEAGAISREGGYTWVVDPLDGTTNFAHHHPVFAVSIAVAKGGTPIVGVIHDPLRDETFLAQREAGATLNDHPIRTTPNKTLENAMVATDWGHTNEQREQMLAYLRPTLMGCGTVRSMGSAALALAYVAAGRLDAYFQMKLNPWDVAAGTLLVREAGGRCTTLNGTPHRMNLPDCLATNGHIHDALLDVIQGANATPAGPSMDRR